MKGLQRTIVGGSPSCCAHTAAPCSNGEEIIVILMCAIMCAIVLGSIAGALCAHLRSKSKPQFLRHC